MVSKVSNLLHAETFADAAPFSLGRAGITVAIEQKDLADIRERSVEQYKKGNVN